MTTRIRGALALVRRQRIAELLGKGELTHRQIAERLGCSIGIVERVARARNEAARIARRNG